jgi:hypothetical protein
MLTNGNGKRRRDNLLSTSDSSPCDHRGVDLISDALPFGRLRYGELNKRNQLRNGLRKASQPITQCCDSRLR